MQQLPSCCTCIAAAARMCNSRPHVQGPAHRSAHGPARCAPSCSEPFECAACTPGPDGKMNICSDCTMSWDVSQVGRRSLGLPAACLRGAEGVTSWAAVPPPPAALLPCSVCACIWPRMRSSQPLMNGCVLLITCLLQEPPEVGSYAEANGTCVPCKAPHCMECTNVNATNPTSTCIRCATGM